jgi:hypothetical protein
VDALGGAVAYRGEFCPKSRASPAGPFGNTWSVTMRFIVTSAKGASATILWASISVPLLTIRFAGTA